MVTDDDPPRKCRDLFRLYNDDELVTMRRLENLQRRRQALRMVLIADYAQENNELNALGLCYGTAWSNDDDAAEFPNNNNTNNIIDNTHVYANY